MNYKFEEALLNYLRLKQLEQKTIDQYLDLYKKFSNINRDLNQRTVDTFLEYNKSSPPRAMIKNLIIAIKRGEFPMEIKSPVALLDIAKVTSRKGKGFPKFIKVSDVNRLDMGINTGDAFFTERIKLMILVQFYGGLRISELLGLSYNDLDKKNYDLHKADMYQTIKIRSESAKFGKEGISYLPTDIYKRLLIWIRKMVNSEGDRGIKFDPNKPIWRIKATRYNTLLLKWTKNILGETYNSHSLRHGRGTNLIIDEHMPIEFVKKYLRHKDIQSTQVYVHIAEKDLKKELEK